MQLCKCGYSLKRVEYTRCYKCHVIHTKGRQAWLFRQRAKAYRKRLYRIKLDWYKRLSNVIETSDYRICEYQPGYPNGSINLCSCPCNGDC